MTNESECPVCGEPYHGLCIDCWDMKTTLEKSPLRTMRMLTYLKLVVRDAPPDWIVEEILALSKRQDQGIVDLVERIKKP